MEKDALKLRSHRFRLSVLQKQVEMQTKYFLTADGKVVKRINPKNIVREKRKLKSYKSLLEAGRMKYEDIEQSARSWMGNYYKLMSKKQIQHMKDHYRDLFRKELQWK